MKGYNVPFGYMGYISETGRYMLFASESDYIDYEKETTSDEDERIDK